MFWSRLTVIHSGLLELGYHRLNKTVQLRGRNSRSIGWRHREGGVRRLPYADAPGVYERDQSFMERSNNTIIGVLRNTLVREG